MDKTISKLEMNEMIQKWGMYRHDHPDYAYCITKGHYLTWTDLGSDIRHIYEKYGQWMLNPELQDNYEDFDDFFWSDIENHMVCIKDIILERIETEPEIINKNAFANVLSAKVIKSIAYGATWLQMESFIKKEIDRATGRRNDGAYDTHRT